ncbi:MAG: hypothetical protein KDA85_03940 [Planctomycetaceae bacterium]|nr:hypothetical protein [Planctomycetaceae bacterium]
MKRLSSILLAAVAVSVSSAGAADKAIDLGLRKQFKSTVVAEGLNNPSGISFSPSGVLTVCDSGNGRVVLIKDGKVEDYITGFTTEYWKVDAETGAKRFKLGPLSSVWLNEKTLAVANAGLKDGEEVITFFDAAGTADSGKSTNAIPPTSDDPADKGEGNLTGLSLSDDGSTIYVAGQGADAKTWVLKVDVASKKMSTAFSADAAGIEINSPMDTMPWNENSILALYSGAGGKDDGLIVQWNTKTGKVMKKWTLPGLTDPMGFARVPETSSLIVVDNNWALTEVKAGRLARVNLPRDAEEAKVNVLSEQLRGPVACQFGPDGALYIAQLGTEFDANKGQILKIEGIKAMQKKPVQ